MLLVSNSTRPVLTTRRGGERNLVAEVPSSATRKMPKLGTIEDNWGVPPVVLRDELVGKLPAKNKGSKKQSAASVAVEEDWSEKRC